MSFSFPPLNAKKEVSLTASGITFSSGIAGATTSMPVFSFHQPLSLAPIGGNQQTSHLPIGVPPAVGQRFPSGAENTSDSPAISFSSSNGESSMDRTANGASMIPFSIPSVIQAATVIYLIFFNIVHLKKYFFSLLF